MVWVRVWIELSSDRFGYLLESDAGIVAYAHDGLWVAPVFSTPANAALFAHQQGATVESGSGGDHDLAALVAFASGLQPEAPPQALDDWVLLDEIAAATKRDGGLISPDDHAEGLLAGATNAAREAARAGVAAALEAARAALVFLDAPR